MRMEISELNCKQGNCYGYGKGDIHDIGKNIVKFFWKTMVLCNNVGKDAVEK